MKKLLAYLILLLPVTALFAHQGRRVTSCRVIDKVTREPLELAVVRDLVTGRNGFTDKEGRFAPTWAIRRLLREAAHSGRGSIFRYGIHSTPGYLPI
jgi:hypothetical protein